MESKTIRHLKDLSSYSLPLLDAIESYYLGEVNKIDLGKLEETVTDLRELLHRLGNVAKTSKSIRQQCGLFDGNKATTPSTDEDKTAESFQDQEPSRNTNMAKDENPESSQEIPLEQSEECKNFRVLMDVSNFSPKKIDVKILEKHLVIHAEHGTLADEHGTISREFTRKFEIPEDVEIETFRALVDCYGVLIVEASFKQQDVKNKTPILLLDPYIQRSFQPYEDLEEFHEIANRHIKDATEMIEFTRKLAKQRPSSYIPLNEVI
ncbi:unnamed protein product [Larinioides sclopetarius]|uniref:SHSP domain-containing protein n=1 Tax=Larinioides sclopetarius TaxID=280406 RepID=A0AAV1ZWI1_9ARAC